MLQGKEMFTIKTQKNAIMFQNIKQKNDFNCVEFVYNFNTGTREPTSADLLQFRVSLVYFRKVGEAAT